MVGRKAGDELRGWDTSRVIGREDGDEWIEGAGVCGWVVFLALRVAGHSRTALSLLVTRELRMPSQIVSPGDAAKLIEASLVHR